ncbi:MAG: Mce-associated rane protein [Pseudonocardiales bacterium]|jgi:Mce-associated membrane protein|nr:Mce-associated rane protein [Pseudonocardiales bacterium]
MTEDADQVERVPEPADEPTAGKVRLTKAERLEAKAARLREAEALAAERAAENAAPAGSRNGWVIALGAVSAVLVVIVVLGAVYLFQVRDDRASAQRELAGLRSAATTRATVVAVATTYAVDFGSYDYRHLDADFKKVASHLTPSFAANYTKSSDGLKPTIVQYQGKSTARVQGVGVSSATTSSATVIVFLDQTVTTSQSTTPRVDRNRLQMKLVRRNGTWLIENLLLK